MTNTDSAPPRYPQDRALEDDLGAWWVMHVKPNCERQVAAYFYNREISYYLPLQRKRIRVGHFKRFRTTEVPLFGGYICFALDKEKHSLLYDSKKFVRIIKVDDQDRFVRELQAVSRAAETAEELFVAPGIVPGRRVLILSGPLEGTEGVVVQRRKTSHLALSVRMFNQTILLRLDPFTDMQIL